jgi:hypothetical protein
VLDYCIEGKSTPGFPLNTLGKTNQTLLSHYTELVITCVEERLNLLLNHEINSNDTAWDLVRKGLVDVVKVFVKNEPHKKVKLEEGRVRLIFSVSLIDNVIARLLFESQNHAEKSVWDAIPCKGGLGLDDDGLIAINRSVLRGAVEAEIAEADVKGWDFSFQEDDFDQDLERRKYLNKSQGTCWAKIAEVHFYCMSLKVFTLSDGTLIMQLQRGIMPSGWYNTTSSNSSARAMNAFTVALRGGAKPWGIFMGDDGVERYVDDAVELYWQLGKTVNMYSKVSHTSFEFCSTQFNGKLGYPLNVDKQLNNMFRNLPQTYADAVSRYSQFEYEFRNHPQRQYLISLVNRCGWWSDCPPPPQV